MDKATTRRGPTGKQTTFGGLVLAFVIALYTYAQPILNERMGWNLPALPKTGSAEVAESKTTTKTASEPKPGPLADRPVTSSTKPTIKPAPASDLNLLYGLLNTPTPKMPAVRLLKNHCGARKVAGLLGMIAANWGGSMRSIHN